MTAIHSKLVVTILLLPLTISIPIISSAETGESRATKIISLTQENDNDNKESSIQNQAKLFIKDLKEKYPHFTDEQLQSMQRAYEDTILENVTAPQIAGEKKSIQKNLELKISPKKKALQGKLKQLVNNNTKKDTSENSKEIKKEAKNTIVSLTVKKGDTLSDIARRTYGDPDMYIAIYEENKDKLRSPRMVPAGITLRVPKIDSSMKEKFSKMKKNYEKRIIEEKKRKIKEKKEQKLAKEKARKRAIEREEAKKEQEKKKKKEKEKNQEDIKENKDKETTKNYKSMEELQRLILEGKY